MSGRKQTPLCVLCTIVERGQGQKVAKAYELHGVDLCYRISGAGTASSDLLDLLGIGTTERDLLISPVQRAVAGRLIEEIQSSGLGVAAKGILFVMPLTAASAKVVYGLQQQKTAEEEQSMEHPMKQSLIVVAVDQGYTETVMNTARAAGARGGTVIRSHIIRDDVHESFGGPTFAGERELIAIVASSQVERNAIMEQIDKEHGGDSDAHAILYALPIEHTARLS